MVHESFDYFVPRGKQVNVLNGERVNAGDPLTSGSPVFMIFCVLWDLIWFNVIWSIKFSKFIVCKVLILTIVILNLLFVKCCVKYVLLMPGDTDFLIGDRVDRVHFKMVNSLLKAEGKRVARQNLY